MHMESIMKNRELLLCMAAYRIKAYGCPLLYYLSDKKQILYELKDSCMYGNLLFHYRWTVAQKGQ